jgi:CheY-like chemotaxis protein
MRQPSTTKSAPHDKTTHATSGKSAPEHVEDFPQRPVMIVDDEEDILTTARIVLERQGFRVVTRTTSPSWEDLRQVQPCVIFMDINLGRESGISACQAIKQNQRFLALPVILISGMDGERLADAASQCHADGFLSKPYSAGLLVKLARHYAERSGNSMN